MLRLTHMILVSQKISFKMTDFAILVGNTHRFKLSHSWYACALLLKWGLKRCIEQGQPWSIYMI